MARIAVADTFGGLLRALMGGGSSSGSVGMASLGEGARDEGDARGASGERAGGGSGSDGATRRMLGARIGGSVCSSSRRVAPASSRVKLKGSTPVGFGMSRYVSSLSLDLAVRTVGRASATSVGKPSFAVDSPGSASFQENEPLSPLAKQRHHNA